MIRNTLFDNRLDGTSASAPIFGGIVSLLNDVRARNGKPSTICNKYYAGSIQFSPDLLIYSAGIFEPSFVQNC